MAEIMAAEKLKALEIKALKVPGRYSDGKGLYFMVDPSGRTARWVFRFSLNKRVTEMGLGGYPDVSLAAAREKAGELRSMVKAGVDPVAEKRETRAAIRADEARASKPTFGDVADDYIKAKGSEWRSEKHRDQWIMTLTKLAAPIRALPVDEITVEHILAMLQPIWEQTPETASRLRGRVAKVIDAASAKGLFPADRKNPAVWQGHLEHWLPKRSKLSKSHHAALPYDDAPAFMARLREMPGVSARALEFLILTAARTNEIVGARWSEIDAGERLWTVPAVRMKLGKIHRVPLCKEAEAILKQLKEIAVDDWVFPSATKGTPISTAAMTAVLRRMALEDADARGEDTHDVVPASGRKSTKKKRKYFKPDITVHGFRSTFRDWAGDKTDFQRETCEAALAHAIGDETEEAYRRGDALAKRRKLMEAWAAYLGGEK
jgi:integrase